MMTGKHSERRHKPKRSPAGLPNKVRTAIIVVVTTIWAASYVVAWFVRGYSPAPEVNLAFMAVVGLVVASYKSEDHHDT